MKLFAPSLAFVLLGGPMLAAPDDLETAYESLKQASESKKEAAEIKNLAAETVAKAREVGSSAAPEGDAEKKNWESHVARAKDIEAFAEYALYASAIGGPAATTVEMMGALEQQNPKSKYLDLGYASYMAALSQSGNGAKAPAIAEKALANFPNNQDLLILLADSSMRAKQPDRTLNYSKRLVAVLEKHPPKPEGYSAADWNKKETQALTAAHYMAGICYAEKNQHYQANVELRAALPGIQGNDAMSGPALFYLGIANYNLGKSTLNKAQVMEAVKFSQQSAGIKGPFAQQAYHNSMVMKTEADRMR